MYKRQYNNRELAFNAAYNSNGRVILGDNNKYWVVSPRDAETLIKQGYQIA